MKKIYSLLFLLLGICCQAQAQKAYYVHLKSGDVQVFYTDLVDSMTVDVVGATLDSAEYVQKIWASDSLYQFKMADIDSISYVTPATQYKPGVIKLEDGLLDYVIGCDSLTLFLAKDTPKRRLPHVGDKLVCLEMTQILPNGFAGEVVKIEELSDKIAVECQLVPLTDIFDCYYGVNTSEVPVPGKIKRQHQSRAIESFGHYDWNPAPIHFNLTSQVNANINQSDYGTVEFATRAELSYQPSLQIRSALIVSPNTGTYVNLSCIGHHVVCGSLAMTGAMNVEFKPFSELLSFELPLAQPLVRLYAEVGPFLRASTQISASQVYEQDYNTVVCWNWSSRNDAPLKNVIRPISLRSSKIVSSEGSINGSIAAGAYLELGLLVADKDIAKAYIKGEVGAELSGNGIISSEYSDPQASSTQVYEELRKTKLMGHFYGGIGLGAETGIPGVAHAGGYIELVSCTFGKPFLDIAMAPEFSELQASYNKEDISCLDVSSQVSGRSRTCDVGFVIHDEDNKELEKVYVLKDYNGESSKTYRHTFLNLPTHKKLKVSPLVSYYNYDAKARPEVEVNAQPVAETGTAFNINETSADIQVYFRNIPNEHLDGGVLYEGKNGLQKASMQITSDGEKSVHLGGLKENTVYSYKAYIQWNGQYIYGETRQFTTKKKEEENPTPGLWVDLGLPSGVKWASHNVGASSPEDYGAYFAWGETSPKASYFLDTYKYSIWKTYEDGNKYFNGFQRLPDFSGNPQYDAAAANWGGGARMPTMAECRELVEHCTSVWTTQNGVNGRLVTGPNGNSIFLPAAGYRRRTSLYDAGEEGYDWSSAPYEDGDYRAYHLYFRSGYFGWYGGWYRDCGLSVRPVRN